jgi:hypothetical protein
LCRANRGLNPLLLLDSGNGPDLSHACIDERHERVVQELGIIALSEVTRLSFRIITLNDCADALDDVVVVDAEPPQLRYGVVKLDASASAISAPAY